MLEELEENIPIHKIIRLYTYEDLIDNLLSGFTIIMIEGYNYVLSLETKALLSSQISEATIETAVKGPNDAFTENYQTNIGMIRNKLKSHNLRFTELNLGTKTKNKIAIIHINDIADNELVNDLIKKIKNINIDSILDSNYILDLINKNHSLFPNYISTERPDRVIQYLLDGRISIVVENTPFAVVAPAFFVDFLHSPEDNYQQTINASLTRLIRVMGLLITLLLPAIYVAVITYNHDAIPDALLLNLAEQREGVPFPAVIEALVMIATFEILKETDIRLPRNIGSALSIVGALVLGEAAIAAGVISSFMVIMVALSAISSLIIYSFDLINGIRWWRLIFLTGAGMAGLIGILVAGFIFIINICSIKSFGKPYLFPISPFNKNEIKNAITLSHEGKFIKRNPLTAKKNIIKEGGKIK